jgi:formaldehyde-activating enzyme involved in methanogenesis
VAFQFSQEYPDLTNEWITKSNYLVILEADNENKLWNILEKSKKLGIKTSFFKEPDLNNELTAIALAPSLIAKKICSNLKLAFKE